MILHLCFGPAVVGEESKLSKLDRQAMKQSTNVPNTPRVVDILEVECLLELPLNRERKGEPLHSWSLGRGEKLR